MYYLHEYYAVALIENLVIKVDFLPNSSTFSYYTSNNIDYYKKDAKPITRKKFFYYVRKVQKRLCALLAHVEQRNLYFDIYNEKVPPFAKTARKAVKRRVAALGSAAQSPAQEFWNN